jgi:hypothetical protein
MGPSLRGQILTVIQHHQCKFDEREYSWFCSCGFTGNLGDKTAVLDHIADEVTVTVKRFQASEAILDGYFV